MDGVKDETRGRTKMTKTKGREEQERSSVVSIIHCTLCNSESVLTGNLLNDTKGFWFTAQILNSASFFKYGASTNILLAR